MQLNCQRKPLLHPTLPPPTPYPQKKKFYISSLVSCSELFVKCFFEKKIISVLLWTSFRCFFLLQFCKTSSSPFSILMTKSNKFYTLLCPWTSVQGSQGDRVQWFCDENLFAIWLRSYEEMVWKIVQTLMTSFFDDPLINVFLLKTITNPHKKAAMKRTSN